MDLTRRRFVALAVIAPAFARRAVAAAPTGDPSDAGTADADDDSQVIDAGLLSGYVAGATDDAYREEGFFVVRDGRELYALSSACTHRACKVHLQPDRGYKCKCHGSQFAPDGRVLSGPAKRDLPRLAVRLDDRRHVLVDLSQTIEAPVPTTEPA